MCLSEQKVWTHKTGQEVCLMTPLVSQDLCTVQLESRRGWGAGAISRATVTTYMNLELQRPFGAMGSWGKHQHNQYRTTCLHPQSFRSCGPCSPTVWATPSPLLITIMWPRCYYKMTERAAGPSTRNKREGLDIVCLHFWEGVATGCVSPSPSSHFLLPPSMTSMKYCSNIWVHLSITPGNI